ncbi:hypothetical protein [Massilia sp. MS-15]|uniref:hypothetical protein n=1 Tax=Massilia sp. MS-15 TaxID=2878200 RepID=UPI001CD68BAA|nr:hypothetical protein [Massilia sp. MS-15]MCA1246416.1 hypothetical protein [Massilia sp. MS-15]
MHSPPTQPAPITPEPLHIRCPRPKEPLGLLLSCAAFGVLAMAGAKLVNDPEGFSWFTAWVMVLFGTALAALVYRNLCVRDTLYLYRDRPEDWAEGSEEMLVLEAGCVRTLRVCPVPEPTSSEGKFAALGVGPGLIEIGTADGCYRFGAGLDENGARTVAGRIAAYCGLQEAGPQWKLPGA